MTGGIITMSEFITMLTAFEAALTPKLLWGVFGLLMFLLIAGCLIYLHISSDHSNFDLVELLATDQKTGKLSDSKMRINAAFLVTCWAFVYLVMNDKFSEWFFFGFMGAWVTDRFLSRKSTNENINNIIAENKANNT